MTGCFWPRLPLQQVVHQRSVLRLSKGLQRASWRRSNGSRAETETGSQAGAKESSTAKARAPQRQKSFFCRLCGNSMRLIVPAGETDARDVCTSCGYVDYFNPKMVVGCIVEHEGKVLLCRRAIEPCKGLWTVPAGYLELNESSAEGAIRETWEEATANVKVLAPYAHFDIPLIGQAYILFRAKLADPFTFSPGKESLDTQLFSLDEIPFDKIAFSSVSIALQQFAADWKVGQFNIVHGVIDKKPGSGPNEPGFELINKFVLPIAKSEV